MPGDQGLPWGTQWDLMGASDASVEWDSFRVTLGFQDGRAGGKAPVNNYFGVCREGAPGEVELGPLGMTMMAGRPEAMAAETAYMKLLEQVRAFAVVDDLLTLSDASGNSLLTFVPSADPE